MSVGCDSEISRRGFIGTITGAAAMSLIGLERRALADFSPGGGMTTDYVGRLCYNENPLGPPQAAITAIENEAEMAHRYPDWYAESLVSDLASKYDLSIHRIVCGAGATEILRLCAMASCHGVGGNVVVPVPSYGQFSADAELLGTVVRGVSLDSNHTVDLAAILNYVDDNTTAVCITNPNNPTGTVLNPPDLETFVDALPSGTVTIVDEAYHDYINQPDYPRAIDLVRAGRNVVVVKTFSKVYGLAGARIGFAVGQYNFMSQLKALRLYAMISRPSLEAAKTALNANQHVVATVDLANQTKAYCFNEFDRMNLPYIPSETNFFMVNVGTYADPIRAALANRGVYVRTGWDMPNYLRVSTGTMSEMQSFIIELEDILTTAISSGNPPVPQNVELYQAYPNPFNSSATIKIYLPQSSKTRVEIFDIQGRLVTKLADDYLGAGEHGFHWNGRNESDKSVSSGSYFYRLIAAGDVITRRMTLVR
jgi:histidinol-phosphate aminotransferase